MTDDYECECSDEYGPCEDHMTVLISRDGAASRTADDLCATFIDDVACLYSDAGRDAPTGDAYVLRDDYYAAIRAERGKADAAHERTGEWQYVSGWAPEDGSVIRPDGSVYVWRENEMGQALADAANATESDLADLGLSVTWEDGYVIYRTTGGPFYEEDEDGTPDEDGSTDGPTDESTDGRPADEDEYARVRARFPHWTDTQVRQYVSTLLAYGHALDEYTSTEDGTDRA